ncbi:MAG: hypothetical protein GX964_10740, partial [Syntrophomonadaceae bacterium]|nr:hypothetical protein [Syntrophomonadaceae bacterium]
MLKQPQIEELKGGKHVGSSRNQRIGEVLLNKELIVPKDIYVLGEIYKIVAENAVLYQDDWGREGNRDIKWKHTVRS